MRLLLDGGRAVLDAAARTLVVDGQPAKLGGRSFDLLVALVAHRERVVPKQELLDLVWPGLVVEENNLQVQVLTLRKVLGNGAIATVSGRGYRLTVDVAEAPPAPRGGSLPATDAAPGRSTASPAAAPAAELIGRDALLREAVALLDAPATRWLTLLGAGGSGKTRLALAAAARCAPQRADGTWAVMLAAVRDPAQALAAVAAALGLQPSPSQPAADQLRDFLRHRRVLLLLDNLEHLLPEAAPALLALLDGAPGVQVLATSRRALEAPCERCIDVPPLALPVDAAGSDAAALRASAAVQLFARRAAELGHPLRDQPSTWQAAGTICRRLDGLPLAIELAAARLRTLTPEALAARLHQSLRLLHSAAPGRDERQQTLRATIAWSHALLPADVQRLFRRLGVCVGGCGLECAEALDENEAELTVDTVDRLDTLVAHHLVQRLDDLDERPRYGMLETIREFALECVEAAGDLHGARWRHARAQAELVRREEAELLSARRPAALQRLAADRGNVREALRFAADLGGDEGLSLSAELVARLGWWWYFDDALREGETWTAPVLARVDAAPAALPAALAARCAITGARLAFYSGAIAVAQQRSAQALERARAAGDVEAEAHALLMRALALNPVSRADADATMAACLDAFRAVGEPWGLALATQYRGVLLYFQPDATAACERFLNEGRARFEALGDLWGSGATAAYLGMIAMARGDIHAAERHAQLNLEVARSTGDRFREAAGLHMLARVALARGDLGAAIEGARENVALQFDRGSRASACDAGRWLAFLQWRHGQPDSAARLLGASGEPGPPTPFSLLLGPERLADIAEVQRALPLALGNERHAELAAEGAALGLERLLGLVGGRDG